MYGFTAAAVLEFVIYFKLSKLGICRPLEPKVIAED
jgi:hypothetical protein